MDFNEGKVISVDIKNEMKKCYIDYAMKGETDVERAST
jgi:DNA gyrase subunit A